jgi:hypothetical protein
MSGYVARLGEKRNAYRLLMGKRPLGRTISWWVDNIKMDLGKRGWVNCPYQTQVPLKIINQFLNSTLIN